MSIETAQVAERVRTQPGLTRAAVATVLGGARARTLAVITEAVEAGLIHEGLAHVLSRGRALRSVRGLYPGPQRAAAYVPETAGAPSAALLTTGSGLRAARQATGVGAPALADVLGVSSSLVYAWEAGRQPIPVWAWPLLARGLEAAQQQTGVTRRRDTRELRELVVQVRREPGITRKALGVQTPHRTQLLERAIRAGRVHQAPTWVGPNRREVTGLFPGALRPRPAAIAVTGEQLRVARQRAGWSQRPVANRLGVSNATLCRWERAGEALPNWATGRAEGVLLEASQRQDALRERIMDVVAQRPGITQEQLTRGGFGRSAIVLADLEQLLAEGRLHFEATPTRNAAGVERHIQGLHLGRAPQLEEMTGADLEKRRRAAGLSRPQLAQLVDLSAVTLYHYERDGQRIPTSRAAALRRALNEAGVAPTPYVDQVEHTDEELEAAALDFIAAHPGLPRRKAAAALSGEMRRRLDTLERLIVADVVHIRPTVTRYADGRMYTLDGLVAGPAADEPEPWAVKDA